MEYFLELLLGGLTKGSIYALIALGYTMVYGIIELINFAHGEIYMIGAFTALIVAARADAVGLAATARRCWLLAAVAAVVWAAAYGFTVEKIAYRPLRQRPAPVAADQRHRHVDLPAELRAAGPDRRLPALPGADPRLRPGWSRSARDARPARRKLVIILVTAAADGSA